jgi:hypothetical protein
VHWLLPLTLHLHVSHTKSVLLSFHLLQNTLRSIKIRNKRQEICLMSVKLKNLSAMLFYESFALQVSIRHAISETNNDSGLM